MVSASRSLLIPVLVAGWLGLIAPAFAANVTPIIKDEAKLFSADALAQANKKIREIYRDYDKDLLIETVSSIPKDLQDKYKDLGKKKFFVEWAIKRAEDASVHGIYVLICKEPSYLRVEVDKQTRKKAFTLDDGDRLAKKMLEKFEDKKNDKRFDAGLLAAVDFVATTLHANVGKRSSSSVVTPGGSREHDFTL